MSTVTIHKAKTELSKLIARVEKGEEVVIARGKTPVARLVPLAEPNLKPRGEGAWEGLYRLPDSFFDPLPEQELRAWEGNSERSS